MAGNKRSTAESRFNGSVQSASACRNDPIGYRQIQPRFNLITAGIRQCRCHRNSENVLVVWNNPQLAGAYLEHWRTRATVSQRLLTMSRSHIGSLAHRQVRVEPIP